MSSCSALAGTALSTDRSATVYPSSCFPISIAVCNLARASAESSARELAFFEPPRLGVLFIDGLGDTPDG